MIHGTYWTEERAVRATRLQVPAGYRLLSQLEIVQEGDLAGDETGWKPVNPVNHGSQARTVIATARPGHGISEVWIVPNRPEDFIDLAAIDRPALEAFARDESASPSLFWECTTCGEPYLKESPHICGNRKPS
jgi:hypothetical protein